MRAAAPSDKHPVRFPKIASIKLDGIRILCRQLRTWTRSNKEVPNKHIRELLSRPEYDGFDIEFIVGPPNAEDVFDRSSSAFRREVDIPTDYKFYVFDYIPDGYETVPYEERIRQLVDKITALNDTRFEVRVDPVFIPHVGTLIHNGDELDTLYSKVLDDGYEGLILRDPTGYYKYGKGSPVDQSILKLKPSEDSEAIILELLEARTNLNEAFTNELGGTSRTSHQENKVGNGMVGKFLAMDIYSGAVFKLSAGQMKHPERVYAFENPDDYVFHIATYRFMPIGIQEKPRMNRYLRLRSLADIDMSLVHPDARKFVFKERK